MNARSDTQILSLWSVHFRTFLSFRTPLFREYTIFTPSLVHFTAAARSTGRHGTVRSDPASIYAPAIPFRNGTVGTAARRDTRSDRRVACGRAEEGR